MIFLPFHPNHVPANAKGRAQALAFEGELASLRERMSAQALIGPAWSAFIGRRAVAFGGVVILHPGVGEAWTTFTEDFPREASVGAKLHWMVKQTMEAIESDFNLHRVQAAVWADYARGIRWLRALRFKEEGLMRRYTSDKRDCLRFARVH